ncbi:outer membrane protein assembly factor BamB family protein [Gordonia spumicola]|uniref:outer membrane protein assembly factor BamB family protein n=1 Tax=Gordonia spumicola TaxID=589161 RepID=UPI00137B1A83|nr:PQQ-binding-like beta-propeller repeat protein [Gordonia spumicola]
MKSKAVVDRLRDPALLSSAAIGVGAGLLAVAAWLAVSALVWGTPNESQNAYGTRGETRFSDIRVPVAGGVAVVAACILAVIAVLLVVHRRPARLGTRRAILILAFCGVVVVTVAAKFARLTGARTDDWGTQGSGFQATVDAWWICLAGLIVVLVGTAATWFSADPGPRLVTVGVWLLTVVVGVGAIGLPPVEDGELTVVHAEMQPKASTVPADVAVPGRVIAGLRSDWPAVGPGYVTGIDTDTDSGVVTADIVMHNASDSSERWRLRIPDGVYTSAAVHTMAGRRQLVVAVHEADGDRTWYGIDVYDGDILWKRVAAPPYLSNSSRNGAQTSYHLLTRSRGEATVTAVDVVTGRDAWTWRAPATCGISSLADRPMDVMVLLQCPDRTRIVRIDAATGRGHDRVAGTPDGLRNIVELEQARGLDGRRFGGSVGGYGPSGEDLPDRIVDLTTGRKLAATGEFTCDEATNCLIADGKKNVTLRSLTGEYPDVAFASSDVPKSVMVLEASVVWTTSTHVVVADRATGRIRTVDGSYTDPTVVGGGVFLQSYVDRDDTESSGLFLPGVHA